MNIPKDCPYTEEEIREGFNTMKKNLKNYYKGCSKEQLIESIVVMTSGMFHLNQERKEEVGKLNSKIEDWERMMNLKTERMRNLSEEDWINGKY